MPPVSSNEANTRTYPSTIHWSSLTPAPSSRLIVGSATLTTVLSSIAIASAKHIVNRTMTFSRAFSPSKPNIPSDLQGSTTSGSLYRPKGTTWGCGRIVPRDGLQPRGERLRRDEGGAHEHEREHDREQCRLDRLDRLQRESGEGGHPCEHVPHPDDHAEREQRLPHARVDPITDQKGDDEHQHRLETHRDGVGGGATGQDRRSSHRQRPEPIDDALLEVVGESDARLRRGEDPRLHEDPGHQEVDVRQVGREDELERAPEHEDEQQDEHHRLDRREHQQVRLTHIRDEVPPGDDPPVRDSVREAAGRAERLGDRAHTFSRFRSRRFDLPPSSDGCSTSASSAACPVRARKTSSSVGRRRLTSASWIPWSSSLRMASVRIAVPSVPTGTLISPVLLSTL